MVGMFNRRYNKMMTNECDYAPIYSSRHLFQCQLEDVGLRAPIDLSRCITRDGGNMNNN